MGMLWQKCVGCVVNSQVIVGSNISTFVVERTKISYGMNLSPNVYSVFLGAGVVFHLNSGLRLIYISH